MRKRKNSISNLQEYLQKKYKLLINQKIRQRHGYENS